MEGRFRGSYFSMVSTRELNGGSAPLFYKMGKGKGNMTFLEWVTKVNNGVNGFVWGIPMLILLIGTGIYFTVRTGFFR